jgi:ribosome-binding factor A
LDSAFFEDAYSENRKRHKDLQLCRQAFRTLSVALSGGCGDEVLAALSVRAVLPAPNATRLLVCLEPAHLGGDVANAALDVPDVLARLERIRSLLRREVAEALVRKRAPELEFVVMPRSGEEVRP